MSLTVVCPTRGRPSNAARLADAFRTTAAEASLLLVVDDDDPTLSGYEALGVPLMVGPWSCRGEALNVGANHVAGRGVVGFMGDDHLPRTPGWDAAVVDRMRPLGVVYGNDLLQGPNLPTAVFLDARIITTLGYMSPPAQRHLYLDDFWKRLGEDLGTLTYLPDVIIEHLHPHVGKADSDEGYERVNSPGMYAHDAAAWELYKLHDLQPALTKLRAVMA